MGGYRQAALPGLGSFVKPPSVKMRAVGPTDEIVACYQSIRGPLVHEYGRLVQKKHAKQMLDADYSQEEIVGCIKWLHTSPQYRDLNWSLAFVGRMMPQYRREHQSVSFCEEALCVGEIGGV